MSELQRRACSGAAGDGRNANHLCTTDRTVLTDTEQSTEQTADILDDFTAVEENAPREEWEGLMRAMRSGKTTLVSQSVAWYFLEVLPPRWMPDGGAFAFCEGDDQYTIFVQNRGQWLMRTLPYGERAHAVLSERAREMLGAYARHLSAVQAQAKDAEEVQPQA